MNLWLKKYYFKLQVNLLLVFKAQILFDKINQLNWYKNTLHDWINDQCFTAKSKVLEVGCASGALTRYIAKSGCIPTGVDSSNKMIEFAKTNAKEIKFLVASVDKLPFENNVFDAVIAASLLNIVPDKGKAIDELYRTCKKGGKITVLVPSDKFTDKNLILLQTSLSISGFSAAAIEAWHKKAPKMNANNIYNLFKHAGLREITIKNHLKGMVVSVSAIKPI